jgi:tetratricopeptide (TPR) repeat protein
MRRSTRPASKLILALVLGFGLPAAVVAQPATPLAPAVQEIRNLLRDKRIDAAIEQAEKVVKERPDDGKAWLWLGNAYGQQALAAGMLSKPKWAGKCRDAYEKAVAVAPGDPDARLSLMQYYLQAPGFLGGGVDKAQAQVDAMATISPAWGHIGRAAVLLVDDRDDEALDAYAAAVAADPANHRALLGLISLHIGAKRIEPARQVVDAAIARDPRDPVGLYMLGRLAIEDGLRIDEGIDGLATYITLENPPEELGLGAAWWRKGLLYEKAGRKDDAVKALQQAVSLDPRLEQAKKDLARMES